ncbi:MAG: hypothetical protein ABIQ44_03370 [Chloroflexia bacterium]
MNAILKVGGRVIAWLVYLASLGVGLIGSAFWTFMLLIFLCSSSFTWGAKIYAFVPLILNLLCLSFAAMLIFRKAWRPHKYEPHAWVSILLAAGTVTFIDYALYLPLRGL